MGARSRVVAFALAGLATACAHKLTYYPLSGEVDANDRKMLVLPGKVSMAARPDMGQVYNLVHLREENGQVGVCMAYLFYGKPENWGDVMQKYYLNVVLSFTPDASQNLEDVRITTTDVPGYPRKGSKFSFDDLKGVKLACKTIPVPWISPYGDQIVKLSMINRR